MIDDIGLSNIQVLLRGYAGELATGREFFETMGLDETCTYLLSSSDSPWKSAWVELFSVHMSEFECADEPTEAFADSVAQGFGKAAEWLNARPAGAFEVWRRLGRKSDVFIRGWLLNEQFDLAIPPSFLLACGRLDLPIKICTND